MARSVMPTYPNEQELMPSTPVSRFTEGDGSMETTRTLTRRQSLRLLAGVALATIPAVRFTNDAAAGRSWCRYDPTVVVDGKIVHLWVSGLLDTTYTVNGPTQVVIRVPVGVAFELLDQDAGFGLGYDISFVEDPKLKVLVKHLEIAADVFVPTDDSGKGQMILVEWIPDGTVDVAADKQGVTNSWLTVATKIKHEQ